MVMRRLGHPLSATVIRAPRRTPEYHLQACRPWLQRDKRLPASTAQLTTPVKPLSAPKFPFRFETGVALFAKRAPRPFPPPFSSPPSGSFSDPLSTHDRNRDRRAVVNGQKILGQTNGDDAVFASEWFICANDGVGAWSTRPRGHAG
jgi:protein phosphatase PTC7